MSAHESLAATADQMPAAEAATAEQDTRGEAVSKRLDRWMLAGVAIVFAAVLAGIYAAKVPFAYFIQPTGLTIVLGGTLGATVITTPRKSLQSAARTIASLWWERDPDRDGLFQELMSLVRVARAEGVLGLESWIDRASHQFLRECLILLLDVQKEQLKAAMETKIRLRERNGEAVARILETAGGFAPAIGVLGTVLGLINVLRNFADLSAVAGGVGAAFASTFYGIGLANLLLIPLAQRVRAAVAVNLETEELILEGAFCILEGVHPSLASERLGAFVIQDRSV